MTGPTFEADLRVTLLATEGDVMRIGIGDRFGWVSKDKLTSIRPESPNQPIMGMPKIEMGRVESRE